MGGEDKICHPNLIGGDPDVDYAGTFVSDDHFWHVTNDSGHFQPDKDLSQQRNISRYANNLNPNNKVVPM